MGYSSGIFKEEFCPTEGKLEGTDESVACEIWGAGLTPDQDKGTLWNVGTGEFSCRGCLEEPLWVDPTASPDFKEHKGGVARGSGIVAEFRE